MLYSMVSDDAFLELFALLEKAEAALDCIIEGSSCKRIQTFADIASDYFFKMEEMTKAMQANQVRV